ncbi:MAG TPA: hypothetical protein VII23_14600 [Terriglobales bacterium]
MKTYVCGAGISKGAGYPLGIELFDELDQFVRSAGPCVNRFDYSKDWPALKRWLGRHKNPVVAEAYRSRQLEHLFTVFDLAWKLRVDALGAVLTASKRGKRAVAAAERAWKNLVTTTDSYQRYRQILMWALEAYLEHKHSRDRAEDGGPAWEYLRVFGSKLCPGDTVLTFNYDSPLERVLWLQKKWSPLDGTGFEMAFQRSRSDIPVEFPVSQIKVLHLHGSVGWYRKPTFSPDFEPKEEGGEVPPEALAPGPMSTPIAFDPIFLRDLDISAVDSSLSRRPASESQVMLHPSFVKDYELVGAQNTFTTLWRHAADALRSADEVVVIGYGLPEADSAALTLLISNCHPRKVTIINRNKQTNFRLQHLLKSGSGRHWIALPPVSLQQWLDDTPDC